MTKLAIILTAIALTAVRHRGVTHEIDEKITFYEGDEVVVEELAAKGAIKPVPEIFADPIVDPVVPADQEGVLPVLSDKMTVAALAAIAVDEGVTIGDGFTKAEIINAIAVKRAADNAGPRQEGLE